MSVSMEIELTALSPIHLSSGKADVIIDAEVAHDEFGMPYFSARRFKGILYESALEVVEMAELSGSNFADRKLLDMLFRRNESKNENYTLQLIVDDLHIAKADEYATLCQDWQQLQEEFPDIINPRATLEEYTSIRYQTSMKDGVVVHGSLHNMRVVDAGVKFYGKMTLENETAEAVNLLALAVSNLHAAGLKRNRGFGSIECHIKTSDGKNEKDIIKKLF